MMFHRWSFECRDAHESMQLRTLFLRLTVESPFDVPSGHSAKVLPDFCVTVAP